MAEKKKTTTAKKTTKQNKKQEVVEQEVSLSQLPVEEINVEPQQEEVLEENLINENPGSETTHLEEKKEEVVISEYMTSDKPTTPSEPLQAREFTDEEIEKIAEELHVIEETPDPDKVEEPEEKEEPQDAEKIIEEFSEAAKELDGKLAKSKSQEQTAEILKDELKRVDEAQKKVEEIIAEKEKELKKGTNRDFCGFWNGVSDGWFN